MCAALVVVSLAALRNSKTPDESVRLMADSRVDYSVRLSPNRASRGQKRVYLAPATTTSTSEPPATTVKPKVVVKPKPVVRQAAPATTVKPKAQSATPSPQPAPAQSAAAASTRPMPSGAGGSNSQEGKASWYRAKYHQDNPWICAHKTIAKGIVLTVTNLNNGATITCEVGDRGPYVEGRILDLSEHAFSRLASPSAGVIPVKITW